MPRPANARFIAWLYNTGHVNDEMMGEHLHPPSPDTLCLLCGPPPMVNYTCWTYSVGFVNDEMIAAHLLPANDDTIVLLCGPPPMINFACNPALDKLGYHPDLRFAY
ncbi:hypothetical protein AWZ03_012354 [Drosophila navojoa]|uniref:Oxidoreductase FAD/NAD(P)-binding domain-containing protein n=1 Tax=Drosophila navojoa TaxID=7232 RepID=A0A484B075_DRONA|nr:hypothetical protein AWZ03_012354 [Drosophila navojoa]